MLARTYCEECGKRIKDENVAGIGYREDGAMFCLSCTMEHTVTCRCGVQVPQWEMFYSEELDGPECEECHKAAAQN